MKCYTCGEIVTDHRLDEYPLTFTDQRIEFVKICWNCLDCGEKLILERKRTMGDASSRRYVKQQQDSLFYRLEQIPMPRESFGTCKYVKKCESWNVILGNGICVKCWDRGLDRGHRKSKNRMLEEGVSIKSI